MPRYLILAEGFSADPHYGKTARGVMRYRRDDVVAVLDSTRTAGETMDGLPVVATVKDALASARTRRSSASRRRAAAFRPRGATC